MPVAVADAARQRHPETDTLRREVAAALRQLWGTHDSEPPRGVRRVRDLEAPAADDDVERRIGSRQHDQRGASAPPAVRRSGRTTTAPYSSSTAKPSLGVTTRACPLGIPTSASLASGPTTATLRGTATARRTAERLPSSSMTGGAGYTSGIRTPGAAYTSASPNPRRCRTPARRPAVSPGGPGRPANARETRCRGRAARRCTWPRALGASPRRRPFRAGSPPAGARPRRRPRRRGSTPQVPVRSPGGR